MGGLRDRVWKDLGFVLLPAFDLSYQPLRTLQIVKGKIPVVEVWKEEPLSAIRLPRDFSLPEVRQKHPEQYLDDALGHDTSLSADVKAAVELAFKLNRERTAGYKLRFYSRSVMPGDLLDCFKDPDSKQPAKPNSDWEELTKESKGMFDRYGTCGIVKGVIYAKHVEMQHESTTQVSAHLDVPADVIACLVLPTGTSNVGGGGSIDVSKVQKRIMDTEGLFPIGFSFILASWTGTEWVFKKNPSQPPSPKAETAPAGGHKWAFAVCPEVSLRK